MVVKSALPDSSDKRGFVRDMFDRIAPRYDLVNRLMTFGLDQVWRRQALAVAGVGPSDRVLDLACGTGDLTELCAERGARVIGADFSNQMLRTARARNEAIPLCQGDALRLPFRSGSLQAVTCGFAMRNFTDLDAMLVEAARVLEPKGRLILLEVDEPDSRLLRWGHRIHMNQIVPRLGSWLSDSDAYRYLPASFAYLPGAGELRAQLEKAGFERIEKKSHAFGAVQRLIARRSS